MTWEIVNEAGWGHEHAPLLLRQSVQTGWLYCVRTTDGDVALAYVSFAEAQGEASMLIEDPFDEVGDLSDLAGEVVTDVESSADAVPVDTPLEVSAEPQIDWQAKLDAYLADNAALRQLLSDRLPSNATNPPMAAEGDDLQTFAEGVAAQNAQLRALL